jgi:hypothetical protein
LLGLSDALVGVPQLGRKGLPLAPDLLKLLLFDSQLGGRPGCGLALQAIDLGLVLVHLSAQPPELNDDLLEEGVDLVLVVTATERRGPEGLADHVVRVQRHGLPPLKWRIAAGGEASS